MKRLAILFATLLPLTPLASATTASYDDFIWNREQGAKGHAVRIKHARELLGDEYAHSAVRATENNTHAVRNYIVYVTDHSLKGSWKTQSQKLGSTIVREAYKYGFDPLFIMAVIQTESSFRPEARGTSGEIGLMQLRPQTAEYIAHKFNLVWNGEDTLKDPIKNVQIGAAYLSYLRTAFHAKSRLYLAAYNMGVANVHRHVSGHQIPTVYRNRVLTNYLHFYSDLAPQKSKSTSAPRLAEAF